MTIGDKERRALVRQISRETQRRALVALALGAIMHRKVCDRIAITVAKERGVILHRHELANVWRGVLGAGTSKFDWEQFGFR